MGLSPYIPEWGLDVIDVAAGEPGINYELQVTKGAVDKGCKKNFFCTLGGNFFFDG
ncbi:hypothetical protein [Phormidium sp. CCY1219]|uniref:hypothetical protein n=1 Tax=Phormidium sp. CCY1219 TaxID=2886104 RepID=UPI002D1F21DE|nr:hypothetical protein [Phormidium sp. CCY1219]MEB3831874.1 hypothetical protein [Phormidium sp. CCY1219]